MSRSILISCLIVMTTRASAQPAHQLAEELFQHGKALMQQARIAEACAAFERSYRFEPSISTLLNHANCREANGQLATAWRLFLAAERETYTSSEAGSAQLNAVAVTRADKLDVRLSKLTIEVARAHRLAGLEILLDEVRLDPDEWGRPLPLDGGTHKVSARAPGRAEWSSTAVIKPEGDAQVVTIPELVPLTAGDSIERPPLPGTAMNNRTLSRLTPPGATSADATATPTKERPQIRSTGSRRHPGLALVLSLGGTVTSYGMLIQRSAPPLVYVGAFGIFLAPSFGHWYAGKIFTRGLLMRISSPAMIAAGAVIVAGGASSSSTAIIGLGALTAFSGTGFLVWGTFEDIATSLGSARRRNRDRGLTIAPALTSGSAGFVVGGRF